MKVVEKVARERVVSIEIIPPKRGENVQEIFSVLDELLKFNISFVSITRHPVEVEYVESGGRIEKIQRVKRPGTLGLTAALMRRYGIDVVPHIICKGMARHEIENLLIDLWIMGVENIFVVRGEETNDPEKGDYRYAYELVRQASEMNKGRYLHAEVPEMRTDFCIGVAGYPEKHYEAPNLEEDVKALKLKVESGASFVITQMVFDAGIYRAFVDRCRAAGIDVPIIPGVKPLVSLKSIYSIPKRFFVTIPQRFVEKMKEARSPEEEFRIGVRETSRLIDELLDAGAPGIHIFTMGRGKETRAVLEATRITP